MSVNISSLEQHLATRSYVEGLVSDRSLGLSVPASISHIALAA